MWHYFKTMLGGYVLIIIGTLIFIGFDQNPVGALVYFLGSLIVLYGIGGFVVSFFKKVFGKS